MRQAKSATLASESSSSSSSRASLRDGKDHVEYELLVVNDFTSPVTLSSVTVLDLSGKELGRIESDVLAAATQTLLTQTQGASIPASAAESVDVDLALPAGTAPDRVTHRIVYAIEPNAPLASIVGTFSINGPEVEVNRTPANDPTAIDGERMVGGQWLRRSQYSSRHPHCHRRFADRDAGNIRNRLDSAERRKTFEGDGARNEDHYAFGADLLAVADGTLRKTYGADFAEGYRSDAELGTVLDREGVATLSEFLKKK